MKDLAIVLGIRPDVIRASKILKLLDESDEIDFDFIWSGPVSYTHLTLPTNREV